jgi:mannan endo-1,4-beta-mannosidase
MPGRPDQIRSFIGRCLILLTVGAGATVTSACVAPARPEPRPSTDGAGRPAVPRGHGSRVLAYLSGPARGKTISGQHNREPFTEPAKWTQHVHDITGKYPGLWGGDLSFHTLSDRSLEIAEAKRQWAAGSLVTLMWHMCPPTHPEPCGWDTPDGVWAKLDDAQWKDLLTDGTALNRAWLHELDAIVPQLRELQNAGVEVLWRPLHEMDESWAWWGGRPGPNGSRRLYQLMRDELLGRAGLTNLVWVWNVSDKSDDTIAEYYPGNDYVDVASIDVWQKDYPSSTDYETMKAIAAGKPIALGEVKTVPSPSTLAEQPDWAWFLLWAEYLVNNSDSAIKATYYDGNVLNQEQVVRDR